MLGARLAASRPGYGPETVCRAMHALIQRLAFLGLERWLYMRFFTSAVHPM